MGRRGEPITSAQLEDAVLRAETGFLRTRDLDLGKVVEIVHRVLASLLSRPSVYGTSSETARNQPCVERSTTRTTRFCSVACRSVHPVPADEDTPRRRFARGKGTP